MDPPTCLFLVENGAHVPPIGVLAPTARGAVLVQPRESLLLPRERVRGEGRGGGAERTERENL